MRSFSPLPFQQVKKERMMWNAGEKKQFVNGDNPTDVASLLKLYFRDLPDPICGHDYYECFISAMCLPDEQDCIPQLKKVLDLLPDLNRRVLGYLCRFMHQVAVSQANMMTYENLAICFSPNLLKPAVEDIDLTISDAEKTKKATSFMFRHIDIYWPLADFPSLLSSLEAQATPSKKEESPNRPKGKSKMPDEDRNNTIRSLKGQYQTLRQESKKKASEQRAKLATSEEKIEFEKKLAERFYLPFFHFS